MSDEDLAQSIFLNALEIADPEERNAYLETQCQGSSDLRLEVDELLGHAGRLGRFMDGNSPELTATELRPTVEKPGTRIGPYKLLQEIGEGGMGVVYLAEQTKPVERRVALKIIKPGMDTRQVVARFEAERQALALMDHPNIAKVLDAGTTQAGRPYFAMELVNGIPVTQFCDEQHLTARERLELFIPICQAVQHAHQKGIIHRDLKPSNILIALYDGRPVPKVIDFGVAKAVSQRLTDKTMFTGLGQVIGTLEYMSPEQAQRNQLDIDTRSDIYSLGVVLYELLTGDTPFDKRRLRSAAFDELLRIIREEEPPRPSTKLSSCETLASVAANRRIDPAKLGKLIQGELDWIVMRTLEKDRARRYETASALAADLDHFLKNEPVTACPPSLTYRCRKFARRNQRLMTTGAAFFVAILVAFSAIGWAIRDKSAREEAIAQEKANQRLAAEQLANQALQLSTESLHDGNLHEARAEALRARTAIASIKAEPSLTERIATRLADLDMLMLLDELRQSNPESTVNWKVDERNQAYVAAFQNYGIDVAAGSPVEIAGICRSREIRLELANAFDAWAFSRSDWMSPESKDTREWRDWQEHLLKIAQAIDHDDTRDRLRDCYVRGDIKGLQKLAASQADSLPSTSLLLLANALSLSGEQNDAADLLLAQHHRMRDDYKVNHTLGCLLWRTDPPRFADAMRFNQAALTLRPESPGLINNLGVSLFHQGKLEEAISTYRESISARRSGDWVGVHRNLGIALWANGQREEAVTSFLRALECHANDAEARKLLCEALTELGRLDDLPRLYAELKPSSYFGNLNLAILLQEQGQRDAAVARLHRAIEIDPLKVFAHFRLGVVLKEMQKPDEAADSFRRAIQVAPAHATSHAGLGNILSDQGRHEDAFYCFRRAVELMPTNALFHYYLGSAHKQLGRQTEAEASFRRAVKLDPTHPWSHFFLGHVLKEQERLDEAIENFRKAADADPSLAGPHFCMGNMLARQGQLTEAVSCWRRAVELDGGNQDHRNALAHGCIQLGSQAQMAGRGEDALVHFRSAVEANPSLAFAHFTLGQCLTKLGRADEALPSYRQAADLQPENPQFQGALASATGNGRR